MAKSALSADTYDVVVVGSGAAGMTAALVARLRGLSVLLIEKAGRFGGTTAISGGGIWIPANAPAKRAGLCDSIDDARTYIRAATGLDGDARIEAFLAAAPAMIEFLEREAGIAFTVAIDRPDYYPDLPGATKGGRMIQAAAFDARRLGAEIGRLRPPARETTFLGMMMRPASDLRHFLNVFRSFRSFLFVLRRLALLGRDKLIHGRSMDLAGGNALIAFLYEAGLRAGIEYAENAAIVDLTFHNDAVRGVEIMRDGLAESIDVRRGVVLATGGFPHDVARRKARFAHAPTGTEHLSPAPKENTGDGIRIAERWGAASPTLSDAACWAPVSRVPLGAGVEGTFPHLIDRQKPGFIAVTVDGNRFVNESHSYHEFGRGLARATAGKGAPVCYLIADSVAVRRYGIGFAKPAPLPLFPYKRSGYLIEAPTIDALAARTGIDRAGLAATIEAFNRDAARGEDGQFRRGASAYQRYAGDPGHRPNPCVAPIVKAPFYAVRVELGELGTFEGVSTDAAARVLRADGTPIEGLYAAGNDMSHVMGGHYIGGGSGIGPAMTFGYLAAQHLADHSRGE